jgi:TonB family protein
MRTGKRLGRSFARRAILTILTVALVAARSAGTPGAVAQDTSCRFDGVLTDPAGRRIPLATLALIDTATGRKTGQQSTESGQFRFPNLPPGTYRFEIAQAGFVRDLGLITLTPGQHLERKVTPEVGTIAEVQRVRMEWARSGGGPSQNPPQAQADPCGPSAPAGCLSPPVKRVNARPVYPAAHLRNAVAGQVRLTGRVGIDGRLEALQPEAGSDPDFSQAALDALRAWRYAPARLGGVPVTCRISLTILFQE